MKMPRTVDSYYVNNTTVKHIKFSVAKRNRKIANKSRSFNFKKAKEAK